MVQRHSCVRGVEGVEGGVDVYFRWPYIGIAVIEQWNVRPSGGVEINGWDSAVFA